MRKTFNLILIAILIASMGLFTASCEKIETEDEQNTHPSSYHHVPVATNNDPYPEIEDTALVAKWNGFKSFLLENAQEVFQNTYSDGSLVQNQKTIWYSKVEITGLITSTSFEERISISLKDASANSRNVASIKTPDRWIEVGLHLHNPCGAYQQKNQTANVSVFGNNQSFTWASAPIQVQWGWTGTNANTDTRLGYVSEIIVHL